MPSVSQISISPVKGLGLVHPDQLRLELTGALENRRFHIVDTDGRRYNQLRNGGLVQIKQDYDAERERLMLTFPDGRVADGDGLQLAGGARVSGQHDGDGRLRGGRTAV